MTRVVLIGNGGHARACADAWDGSDGGDLVGCVAPEEGDVLGLPWLGGDDDLERVRRTGVDAAFVAVGSARVRRALTQGCDAAGLRLVSLVAGTARVGRSSTVGAGAAVMHGAVVGAAARVGPGAIVNTGASVDHDCVVGAFAHVAPGVHLAGDVHVGDDAFVGVGASVVPGVRIGAGATVGAGAVVLADVAPGTTVVGVPARVLVGAR